MEKRESVPITCTIRLRLKKTSYFFGPGVLEVLQLVEKTDSLQTAAATMEMSYSKAWKIVRAAEQELGFKLMDRRVGGVGGGSSQLTPRGKDFVARFEQFSSASSEATNLLFEQYFGDFNQRESDEQCPRGGE